jgi:hypothetical protein
MAAACLVRYPGGVVGEALNPTASGRSGGVREGVAELGVWCLAFGRVG